MPCHCICWCWGAFRDEKIKKSFHFAKEEIWSSTDCGVKAVAEPLFYASVPEIIRFLSGPSRFPPVKLNNFMKQNQASSSSFHLSTSMNFRDTAPLSDISRTILENTSLILARWPGEPPSLRWRWYLRKYSIPPSKQNLQLSTESTKFRCWCLKISFHSLRAVGYLRRVLLVGLHLLFAAVLRNLKRFISARNKREFQAISKARLLHRKAMSMLRSNHANPQPGLGEVVAGSVSTSWECNDLA